MTRITAVAGPPADRRVTAFEEFVAELRAKINDGHHRGRRHRHARPAPHHPAGVRRPVRLLRLRRAQPGLADHAAACSPRSTSRASTPRTRTSEDSTTRSGSAPRASTTARGGSRSSSSCTTSSSRPPSQGPPTSSASSTPRSRSSTSSSAPPTQALTRQFGQVAQRRGRPHPRPVHRHRHVPRPAAPVRPHQARGPGPQVHHASCTPTRSCCSRTTSPPSTSRLPTRRAGRADRRVPAVRGHRPRRHLPARRGTATAMLDGMEVFRRRTASGAKRQKAQPIMVVIGNPPYSVGPGRPERRQPERQVPDPGRSHPATYAARSTAT